jgi:hypothetical protein
VCVRTYIGELLGTSVGLFILMVLHTNHLSNGMVCEGKTDI